MSEHYALDVSYKYNNNVYTRRFHSIHTFDYVRETNKLIIYQTENDFYKHKPTYIIENIVQFWGCVNTY